MGQVGVAHGAYVPTLGLQLLPGCPNCGAKHPLAHKPSLPPGECPGCGAELEPAPPARMARAVLVGLRPRLGLGLIRFGLWLNSLRRYLR